MRVVFVSNFYNHHQSAFSEEMYRLLGENYTFVQTQDMDSERKQMGWGIDLPSFVIKAFGSAENYNKAINLINEADIVIFGATSYSYIRQRVKQGKIILFYSERIFKKGPKLLKQIYRFFYFRYKNNLMANNPYLLSSGAYVYSDYSKLALFNNRAYKWGYFPKVKEYEDIDKLISTKSPNSILWVSRLIKFKHVEVPLTIAKRLKDEGYTFTLDLIGTGEMEQEVKSFIADNDLGDVVRLHGSMTPDEVRAHMEKAEIFLFTSDFGEGWGAVLNESMNSACTIVASHAIGSVPYLVKDGVNGFIYKNGDINECYTKVKFLLDNPKYGQDMGKQAYYTMKDEWNAKIAAERVVQLSQEILKGNKRPDLFASGPCSKSNKLKNNWYK